MATIVSTIVANFKTTLANRVIAGDSTATLSSNLDKDSVAIPNGTYTFLIDKDSAQEEHFQCTVTGTALTVVRHVTRQGGDTANFSFNHAIGAEIILTDFVNIQKLSAASGGGGTIGTILAYASNFVPTLGLFQLPAWDYIKTYVDGVVVAGAPDASTVTKGITTMSVAPVVASTPISVGDNDPRMPILTQKNALVGTLGTPDTTNPYVTKTGLAQELPVGTVVDYISPTAPTNWAICNGSAISRTTYASLFAVIGTAFGVGDGATTFNIPDARGRVSVMQDGTADFDVMGETGGAKTHTLTIAQMPAHSHQYSNLIGGSFSDTVPNAGNISVNQAQRPFTDSQGGGTAHNNLQPYIVMTKIIKII